MNPIKITDEITTYYSCAHIDGQTIEGVTLNHFVKDDLFVLFVKGTWIHLTKGQVKELAVAFKNAGGCNE